jgi:hypothetical protein
MDADRTSSAATDRGDPRIPTSSEMGSLPDSKEGRYGGRPGTTALRDRLACWLCNVILNHLATPWYRKMVGGSIRYGLLSAANDAREELNPHG